MSEQEKEAYEKLKQMALFSESYEGFSSLFFERLHEGREVEALGYVLRVTYALLQSEGEVFNEILSRVEPTKKVELVTWLNDVRGRV